MISTSWFSRQAADEVVVERLGEARVGNRRRQAERGELVGRLEAFGEPRAERQDGDRGAFAHDAALADLERTAFRRQLHADALAARIAEGGRPVVDGGRGRHHVLELGLVGGRHQHEARQAAEIGEIEGAGMRRAVGADEAGAVERKAHRQPLDRDVVHDLVVGALQERRVDGGERLEAFGGQAGGERHAVLLGDADVEGAVAETPWRTGRARCRTASPR